MITGQLERTIGSLKNSLLTFAQEKHPEPLEKKIERALGALKFYKNATLKISPFEAHHGREANTVLRKLTKKTISPKSGLVAGYKNEKCFFRWRRPLCEGHATPCWYELGRKVRYGVRH